MTTESFELVRAGDTCWGDHENRDDIVLVLEERDDAGVREGGTRIATFSNMRFMNSLGPRLAKLCQETAQAELNKAGGVRPRAPATGPEPFAQIGDDVFVTDYDWRNPKLAWPGTWLFHDVKRNRPLFQARKRDVGDDPPVEVLVALLLAFAAGERAGRKDGRVEGRAALAGDLRKLMGVGA
ncbi:hypothetical protein [Methylorubrum sp. SB2]|uniref:hypothetical protein n=1 Tax=Methylorubrum subtropicum TaxID=3138812 RepID=UPI00313E4D0F